MKILDIIPTQNCLRNYKTVERCVDILERGERLTPINLSLIEDGAIYLHDGMHRLCALYLVGAEELLPAAYTTKSMLYEQYASINWEVGYVTPFDLRTECRIADLYKWKTKVFAEKCGYTEEWVNGFIHRNRKEYVEKRRVWNVEDVLKGGVPPIKGKI